MDKPMKEGIQMIDMDSPMRCSVLVVFVRTHLRKSELYAGWGKKKRLFEAIQCW
jgi:hypothetical protein